MRRGLGSIRSVAIVAWTVVAISATSPVRARDIDFNRDVRPILSDKCFQCHGPDEATREAELRLDDEAVAKADRDGMFVVKPGDPDGSELIRRITSDDEVELMPPPDANKPLTDQEKNILRKWIADGASWSQHWAYVPPVRHDPPAVKQADWPLSWIDNFILNRLEREQIAPSSTADRVTLLRRVCFDLTGLPPTHEMAKAFLADDSPAAYERLVDQLLASPHYGERMATYWLDLVRYADTVGYHGDQVQNISPYRDWVIAAFNNNQPFDEFTRDQLAGDLVPKGTQEQVIATGYNRLLQTTHEGGLQPKEYRAIYGADRVRNFSAVWLGATVGCAQCHDHKFDPYTSKDFYALGAFFADVDDEQHFTKGTNANPTARPPELNLPTPDQQSQLEALNEQLNSLRIELRGEGLTAEELQAIKIKIRRAKEKVAHVNASVPRTMITVALKEPRVVRLLPRGNWLDETGPIVEPAIPRFMGQLQLDHSRANRLDLANWLVDDESGAGLLTARVMANRLWYLCFGNGLAGDLDDFGAQGEPPAHPELLDQLAHGFVDSHWDMRAMLKLIVTSRTYRQSSAVRADLREVDPHNRLCAAQTSFRLPAEMIRDNALAISGLLVDDEVGGPSIKPYQPDGYFRHLNFPERTYHQDNDERQWRRGVYVHWQRQFLHPMLKAFDAPSREECTAQRPRSNTPLAALTLLNDPTFIEAARSFGQRVLDSGEQNDDDRLAWAFHEAVFRYPTDAERSVLKQLLIESRSAFAQHVGDADAFLDVGLTKPRSGQNHEELAAWAEVCRAILNLSETNMRN